MKIFVFEIIKITILNILYYIFNIIFYCINCFRKNRKNQSLNSQFVDDQLILVKNNNNYSIENRENIKKIKDNTDCLNNIKPVGLMNVKLNCYMNSVIQCLFHLKKFRYYFINRKNFSKEDQPVSFELRNIMLRLNDTKNREPFSLSKFKEIMGEINDIFKGSGGADASDLLRYIFSSLYTENSNLINNFGLPLDETNEKEMFNAFKRQIQINSINNFFYIFYKFTYICKKNHTTYNFEESSFLDFNLSKIIKQLKYKNKKTENITLDDCFICFNDNRCYDEDFECSVCQNNLLNSKSNIYLTNDYLVIIFDYGKNKKLNIDIFFDEYINIDKFIEKKNNLNYKLIGTIVHYGSSSSSGHYISYCRCDDNKFYKFNDNIVTEANYEELLREKTTYVLFYKKCNKY